MEWSMKDPAFKAQLFRFVDVLPSLNSSAEIVRHLQEYLGDKAVELNPAMKVGLAASSFAPGLIAGPVKANVVSMAAQFVAGETGADLVKQIKRNHALGLATTIDLLGETVVSESEADAFLARNLEILDSVSAHYAKSTEPCFSDVTATGPLPRLNLSVKISALTPDVHPADPENSVTALKPRLRAILRRATAVGAFINFDMESYKLKDLTLALFKSILEEPEFAEKPAIGIAIASLPPRLRSRSPRPHRLGPRPLAPHRRPPREGRLLGLRNHRRPTARLAHSRVVRKTRVRRQLRKTHAAPPRKHRHRHARPSPRTTSVPAPTPIAQAERLEIDPTRLRVPSPLRHGRRAEVRACCSPRPPGPRILRHRRTPSGMAYLVRRLLENTEQRGLPPRQKYGRGHQATNCSANPVELLPPDSARHAAFVAPHFHNAANTDFTRPAARDTLRTALAAVTARLGQKHALIIGGKKISDRELIASVNPARPAQTIGTWARATLADADAALAAARAAFPAWRDTPVDARAQVLERAADLMEARRQELNALLILEAGKPWLEADGDVERSHRLLPLLRRRDAPPRCACRHAGRPPASAACSGTPRAAPASSSPRGISRSRSSAASPLPPSSQATRSS